MRRRFYLLLLQTKKGSNRPVLTIYLSILTSLLMFPFTLFLVPLLCQKKSAINEVESQNKLRQYDFALEKWWVTRCGLVRLCTAVHMGMTTTSCWKLFRYGVKRDHYDKFIGIREFSEGLAKDFFNNKFSPDIETPERAYLPLMRLIMEIQFLPDLNFMFPVLFIPLQRSALFLT